MNWCRHHPQQQQQQQQPSSSSSSSHHATSPPTPTPTATTTTSTPRTTTTAAAHRPPLISDATANTTKASHPVAAPVKLHPRPIASSIALLSLLCLLIINWAGRLNVSSLLSFHSLSRSSSSSSSLSELAAANPIPLYYPSVNHDDESKSTRTTTGTTTKTKPLIPPSVIVTNQTMRCIIYDRPPRTGSTTVYKYLDRCLAGRGYGSSLRTYRGVHDHALLDYFNKHISSSSTSSSFVNNNTKPITKKSLITRHLAVLPASSLQTTLSHCTLLLYITSTRPIRERLLSKLKYELPDHTRPGKIIAEKRRKVDAVSLHKSMRDRLAHNMSSLFPAEMYYEAFPAVSPPSMANSVAPLFVPDYVIRSNRFMSDFKALLDALRCPTKFQGANVHRVENVSFDDQQLFLDAVPVAYGDARYRALAKLAGSANERGLRKAALYF